MQLLVAHVHRRGRERVWLPVLGVTPALFVPPTDTSSGASGPDHTTIVMVDERELLRAAGVDKMESWWNSYSLQMILKLLASSLVVTNPTTTYCRFSCSTAVVVALEK